MLGGPPPSLPELLPLYLAKYIIDVPGNKYISGNNRSDVL